MQNRYVGDIGDFGKYGLLRALAGDPLRLGVVWYLFPDEPPKEPGKGDGKFIDYLCHPTAKERNLIECDPFLHDKLHKIVIDEKDRRVVRVQEKESGILPTDTLYYDQSLSYEPRESGDTRKLRRAEWLNSALEATKEADVVFVDPDNGIAIPDNGEANQAIRITKANPYGKRGPKYVFMDDLKRFYCNGKSLVIYHHLARTDAVAQINCLRKELQESLGLSHLPWALWYHRGTARAYFIVAQKRHRAVLEKRLGSFADSPWCAEPYPHFQQVT